MTSTSLLAVACLFCINLAYAQMLRDPEEYKGHVEVDFVLNERTGRVTYTIRCVSDTPVRLHLRSLENVSPWVRAEPVVNLKNEFPLKDIIKYNKSSKKVTLIIGRRHTKAEMDRLRKSGKNVIHIDDIKEKPTLDRVVQLKTGEAVSTSFMIWEVLIWQQLQAALKKRKYKEYRVTPFAMIYTADERGKPAHDHIISVWEVEVGPDGELRIVFKNAGFIMDLRLARKLQRLQAKAEREAKLRKQRQAQRQGPAILSRPKSR